MDNPLIRQAIWYPYAEGKGPCFVLSLFDLDQDVARPYARPGKHMLGYKLEQCTPEKNTTDTPTDRTLLFAGQDFGCSPLHPIDGDETIQAIMSFLTLVPGDVEAGYFDTMDPRQAAYTLDHAEALAAEVAAWMNRLVGETNE